MKLLNSLVSILEGYICLSMLEYAEEIKGFKRRSTLHFILVIFSLFGLVFILNEIHPPLAVVLGYINLPIAIAYLFYITVFAKPKCTQCNSKTVHLDSLTEDDVEWRIDLCEKCNKSYKYEGFSGHA